MALTQMLPTPTPAPGSGGTSVLLRRAKRGDRESLDWIVRRLSPLLLAQASSRLGRRLRRYVEPADLVNEVWLATLPRLDHLPLREGHVTPALLRFLSTTLFHKANRLLLKHVRRQTRELPGIARTDGGDPLDAYPGPSSDAVTSACRRELEAEVTAALRQLEPRDREVVMLRALDQTSNQTVAELLGVTPKSASQTYRRALGKLRRRLRCRCSAN